MLVSGGQKHMTKADLVEKVTGLGDLTRRDGEVIVETIFGSVIGALQSGDKIEIRGFGSFRIRQRNPRIGRNPKTGARVEVHAKKVPYFKPSKELRDLVNPGEAGPRLRIAVSHVSFAKKRQEPGPEGPLFRPIFRGLKPP